MRSEGGLVLAAQQCCSLCCETAEDYVARVNDMPDGVSVARLGAVSAHGTSFHSMDLVSAHLRGGAVLLGIPADQSALKAACRGYPWGADQAKSVRGQRIWRIGASFPQARSAARMDGPTSPLVTSVTNERLSNSGQGGRKWSTPFVQFQCFSEPLRSPPSQEVVNTDRGGRANVLQCLPQG